MKSKFRFLSLLSWLGKDKHSRGPRLLARLLHDEEGSYLLIMTVAMPVFIGVAGLASEAGLLFYNHRSLQSAADGAAYSAAIAYSYDTSADITTQAKAIVASYGFTLGTGNNQANVPTPTIITNYAGSGNKAIQVSVSRPQSTFFAGYYGLSFLSNSVNATAVIAGTGGAGGGGCILALGNTNTSPPANAPDAISLQGNPIINAPGCGIFTNSNDCAAGAYSESLGGSASVTAGSFTSSGCMNIFGNAQVHLPNSVTCNSSSSAACIQSDGTLSDPLAGTQLPTTSTPGSCTATATVGTNGRVSGTGKLCPGVYIHGLDVTGTGGGITVTLGAGIYILNCSASTCPSIPGGGNAMVIVKNATLTDNGAGVTLVFTCSSCTNASQWPSDGLANLANGAISLTAPTSGTTAGFVMMGDSSMALNTAFDSHSNPNVCLNGTVYLPKGFLEMGGTPTSGCNNSCLQLIVNKLSFTGNSTNNIPTAGCTVDGSRGSGGRQVPIGSVVTLVH